MRWRPIETVMCVGILIVLAGLFVPVLRSQRIAEDVVRARQQLEGVRDAMRAYLADARAAATDPSIHADRYPHRLCGPGQIAPGSYFAPDALQGVLGRHLVDNEPLWPGGPTLEGRHRPYHPELSPDPWGQAFIVVLYPLFLEDERDCIVISAGPNGRMDGSYASPFDVVPAGDDLLEVIVDKSRARAAPWF